MKKSALLQRRILAVVIVFLAATFGCAGGMKVEPISPYIDPGIRSYNIRTLAVMPFVVPAYMGFAEGGHRVSATLSNDLLQKVHALRVYHITDPSDVAGTITEQVGPISEWVFTGNRDAALLTAQSLGCDGVLFPVVHTYRQGNLIDSEVEIELTLIDVFSSTTVWSIRENVRGKAGKASMGQPVRSPSADKLAQSAIVNAARKIEKINQQGADFTVSTVSPRKIAGYSVLSAGIASAAATGYFYYEAQKAFDDYKKADSSSSIRGYKNKVEDYDTLWMVFGGVSVAALGTGAYLLLTGDTYSYADMPAWLKERRVDVVPAWNPDGGGQIFFRYSF